MTSIRKRYVDSETPSMPWSAPPFSEGILAKRKENGPAWCEKCLGPLVPDVGLTEKIQGSWLSVWFAVQELQPGCHHKATWSTFWFPDYCKSV